MYRVASASVSSATAALASKVPAVPMLTGVKRRDREQHWHFNSVI
jgi:hypothetical protein